MRTILLIFIMIICISYSKISPHFNSIRLEEIDFADLILVKQTSGEGINRCVYRNTGNTLYYKIWEIPYFPGPHFLDAVNAGFFDTISPLLMLIFDSDQYCRGYITKACIPISETNDACKPPSGIHIVFDYIPYRVSGQVKYFQRLAAYQKQDDKYKKFYHNLLEVTQKTGYAFIDLSASNVVLSDGEYKVIDLESVDPIHNLRSDFFANPFSPENYVKQIKDIQYKTECCFDGCSNTTSSDGA